jgi:hypothetical protein
MRSLQSDGSSLETHQGRWERRPVAASPAQPSPDRQLAEVVPHQAVTRPVQQPLPQYKVRPLRLMSPLFRGAGARECSGPSLLCFGEPGKVLKDPHTHSASKPWGFESHLPRVPEPDTHCWSWRVRNCGGGHSNPKGHFGDSCPPPQTPLGPHPGLELRMYHQGT